MSKFWLAAAIVLIVFSAQGIYVQACREGFFACPNSNKCILVSNTFCNGCWDCPGGEDEPDSCVDEPDYDPRYFRCGDGECIVSDYRCDEYVDCADGSDEADCHPAPCGAYQYSCKNSTMCLDEDWVCNYFKDCPLQDDEENCNCTRLQWECANHECIQRSGRCNKRIDCQDGSDEEGCPTPPPGECLPGEFQCDDGTCLLSSSRCNRWIECANGEDETEELCPCQSGDFRCGPGDSAWECIEFAWVCDGTRDCQDFSDETNCPCKEGHEFCSEDAPVCINPEWRCDYAIDCPGGIDEGEQCNYTIMARNSEIHERKLTKLTRLVQ